MKAWRAALAGTAGLLVLLSIAACDGRAPEDPEEDRPLPPVEVMVVSPTPFDDWVETTGTVEARDDARLTAEVGGTVTSVLDEGTRVSRGQVVAQIEPAQAQAAVRRARAALAEADAALEEAQEAHRRWQPLVKEAIISELEFEQVRGRRDQALAGRQQAIEALREAEQMLEQTRLRAPFAGVVEERLVRGGEQVTPGEPLVRLVGAGPRIVTAGLPERFAADIQPGARAIVGLQAYGLDEIVSAVSFVGAAVDPQSRTFPVRIEIDEPDARVKVDMIARVRVVRRTLAEALVVPRDAILRDEREETVLVVEARDGDRGTLARRVIAAGPAALEGVVIEAGLQPGDEVVVVGQQERQTGEDVRVVRQHDHMEAYRAAAGTGRDP